MSVIELCFPDLIKEINFLQKILSLVFFNK